LPPRGVGSAISDIDPVSTQHPSTYRNTNIVDNTNHHIYLNRVDKAFQSLYDSNALTIASRARRPRIQYSANPHGIGMRRQHSLLAAVNTNEATVKTVWTSPPDELQMIAMRKLVIQGMRPSIIIREPCQPSTKSRAKRLSFCLSLNAQFTQSRSDVIFSGLLYANMISWSTKSSSSRGTGCLLSTH
jgi:hypothetical protein